MAFSKRRLLLLIFSCMVFQTIGIQCIGCRICCLAHLEWPGFGSAVVSFSGGVIVVRWPMSIRVAGRSCGLRDAWLLPVGAFQHFWQGDFGVGRISALTAPKAL